jgi:hypothetical protein
MRKTREADNQTIRPLHDLEIELVTGGVMEGGCVRLPVVSGVLKSSDWSFQDQFAKYTIGRYTRVAA